MQMANQNAVSINNQILAVIPSETMEMLIWSEC